MKAGEAPAEKLPQVAGNGQRPAGGEPRACPGELPPHLEREERVTGRCVVKTDELRTHESKPEPLLQQLVERAAAERLQRQPFQHAFVQRVLEREREGRVWPHPRGREKADPLIAETSERGPEHAGRRRIEPLQVIDCHENRPRGGKRAHDVEEGESDRAGIRRLLARLLEEEGDFQGTPPRGSEGGQRLLEHVGEKVCEGSEGKPGLRFHAAIGEDTGKEPARALDSRFPEDRLADARFAAEDQRGGAAPGMVQEGLDQAKLLLPSKDCRRHALARL